MSLDEYVKDIRPWEPNGRETGLYVAENERDTSVIIKNRDAYEYVLTNNEGVDWYVRRQ